jgi:hypothetical protein
MKKHFISLFDAGHIRETIRYFVIAALLIITSLLAGIDKDWSLITMFFGIILLYFAMLHPWEKVINYGILAVVCLGILLLEWLGITILDNMGKGEYINDNVAEGIVFFVCIPGILVSAIGAIICAAKKK